MKRIVGLRTRDLGTLLSALDDAESDRVSFARAYTHNELGGERQLCAEDAALVQRTYGLIKRYKRLRALIVQEIKLRGEK